MNFNPPQKLESFLQLKILRKKLLQIPKKPGVYLHKDINGEILYVGKAKNLYNRLKNYFTGVENHSPKTKALVAKIHDFEVIVTENEYESLLLESNLIKHNQPNYNVLLRDDKSYPYIKIDINENWPRVTISRKRKTDGSLYFGPYSASGQVNQLMNMINRFFPLIKCTPMVFKTVTRPCNYYDIKRCLGPCKLNVSKDEYILHLNSVIDILNLKYKDISVKLKKEMQNAATQMNFEKAAILRDQLKALENLSSNQSVTLDIEIDIDILGSYWNDDITIFYVTNIRNGKVISGNSYPIKHLTEEPLEDGQTNLNTEEKERIYSAFICQYYQRKSVPSSVIFENSHHILSDSNIKIINEFLNAQRNIQLENEDKINNNFLFFTKKEDYIKYKRYNSKNFVYKLKDLTNLSNQNAENKFHEITKLDENSNIMMLELQKFLELKSLPKLIECYDISTFNGSETVASQVTFKNAKALKSSYKKYIIRDIINHNDDFASLREVIRKRFKDHNNFKLPDLIIIDGGTPQIREVGFVLESLGLSLLPIVGIAKARVEKNFSSAKIINSYERIVIPKRSKNGEILPNEKPETKVLKQGSPEFKLVTQIRDEAHRFAITFHRTRRDKKSMKSEILNIQGLGAKRRKKLIELYPDLKKLGELNIEIIYEKTKIPVNILQKIIEKINQKK